jgi:hypothetical protein
MQTDRSERTQHRGGTNNENVNPFDSKPSNYGKKNGASVAKSNNTTACKRENEGDIEMRRESLTNQNLGLREIDQNQSQVPTSRGQNNDCVKDLNKSYFNRKKSNVASKAQSGVRINKPPISDRRRQKENAKPTAPPSPIPETKSIRTMKEKLSALVHRNLKTPKSIKCTEFSPSNYRSKSAEVPKGEHILGRSGMAIDDLVALPGHLNEIRDSILKKSPPKENYYENELGEQINETIDESEASGAIDHERLKMIIERKNKSRRHSNAGFEDSYAGNYDTSGLIVDHKGQKFKQSNCSDFVHSGINLLKYNSDFKSKSPEQEEYLKDGLVEDWASMINEKEEEYMTIDESSAPRFAKISHPDSEFKQYDKSMNGFISPSPRGEAKTRRKLKNIKSLNDSESSYHEIPDRRGKQANRRNSRSRSNTALNPDQNANRHHKSAAKPSRYSPSHHDYPQTQQFAENQNCLKQSDQDGKLELLQSFANDAFIKRTEDSDIEVMDKQIHQPMDSRTSSFQPSEIDSKGHDTISPPTKNIEVEAIKLEPQEIPPSKKHSQKMFIVENRLDPNKKYSKRTELMMNRRVTKNVENAQRSKSPYVFANGTNRTTLGTVSLNNKHKGNFGNSGNREKPGGTVTLKGDYNRERYSKAKISTYVPSGNSLRSKGSNFENRYKDSGGKYVINARNRRSLVVDENSRQMYGAGKGEAKRTASNAYTYIRPSTDVNIRRKY